MLPSEILDKAADIILRDGWHQGAYFKTSGWATAEEDAELAKTAPCCQDGAIMRAAFGTAWVSSSYDPFDPIADARRRADRHMMAYVSSVHGDRSPIQWNDRPSTTKDDVVAALRGAADSAREAGE